MKRCVAKAQEIAKKIERLTLEQIKKMPFELGVDEAGRGPIFGPMIYSALWWPKEFAQQISALGFTDSKKLSEANRELLYQAIQVLKGKAIFYEYDEISAEYISNKMLAQKNQESLNIISHKSAIKLIKKAIDRGFNIVNVYLDTVGDAGKYQDKVNQELQNDRVAVTVSAKADLYYKVVSAASIIAKVTRDHKLRDWAFVQGINTQGQTGSGYPSDPKTVNWLKVNYNQVFGYPNLIRFSWATLQNMQKVPKIQFKNKAGHPKFDADYILNQKYGLVLPKSSIFTTLQEE